MKIQWVVLGGKYKENRKTGKEKKKTPPSFFFLFLVFFFFSFVKVLDCILSSVAPADVLVEPPDLLAVLLEHRRDDVADRHHPQKGPALDDGHVADVVLDHQAHHVDDRGLRR